MSSIPAGSHAAEGHHASTMTVGSFISTYVFSRDHKIIGLQFLFSTLLWFLIGGLLALGIRWQLAYPEQHAGYRQHVVCRGRWPDLA